MMKLLMKLREAHFFVFGGNKKTDARAHLRDDLSVRI